MVRPKQSRGTRDRLKHFPLARHSILLLEIRKRQRMGFLNYLGWVQLPSGAQGTRDGHRKQGFKVLGAVGWGCEALCREKIETNQTPFFLSTLKNPETRGKGSETLELLGGGKIPPHPCRHCHFTEQLYHLNQVWFQKCSIFSETRFHTYFHKT